MRHIGARCHIPFAPRDDPETRHRRAEPRQAQGGDPMKRQHTIPGAPAAAGLTARGAACQLAELGRFAGHDDLRKRADRASRKLERLDETVRKTADPLACTGRRPGTAADLRRLPLSEPRVRRCEADVHLGRALLAADAGDLDAAAEHVAEAIDALTVARTDGTEESGQDE